MVSLICGISTGIRTPLTVQDLQLEQPTVYDQLSHIERLLERHYRDMQVNVLCAYVYMYVFIYV